MKTIICRWTGESAQQCNVVTPRPQARTKGYEGHRVGLGATHSGQQDVVSRRGFDRYQGDTQEQGESMRDNEVCHLRDVISTTRYKKKKKIQHVHLFLRSSSLPVSTRTMCYPSMGKDGPAIRHHFSHYRQSSLHSIGSLSSRTLFIHRRGEKRVSRKTPLGRFSPVGRSEMKTGEFSAPYAPLRWI